MWRGLSTVAHGDDFESPRDRLKTYRIDYELGGVAIGDASLGLRVKNWRAFTDEDGTQIWIESHDVEPELWITGVDITEISLTFDQAMHPVVAWMEDGEAKFQYFEGDVLMDYLTVTLDPGCTGIRVCLDDKRPTQQGNSEIIVAYTRDDNLCVLLQSEGYETEHVLTALDPDTVLVQIGMNRGKRFQFQVRP